MAFIGEYSGKLDDKGRLIFPSELRAQASSVAVSYVVRRSVYTSSLEMYSMEEWDKLSAHVKASTNIHTAEGDAMWLMFNRNRAIVTPDEKTGRILIPKQLLESVDIKKEVVFVGQDFKIQIWAKEQWTAETMSNEDFAKLYEKLMSGKS